MTKQDADKDYPATTQDTAKAENKPEKPKRTKTPKEEAIQVTVKLTPKLRKKLLELNQEHSETARYDLPLTATVALAIEIAHEAYFPPKKDQAIEG